VEDVGFLPLNGYLERSGRLAEILPSRLATWSKDGIIFGIPHDVHPVTITYREDLFREAGIDLASALTWTQFQDKCLAFQRYWAGRGMRYRHAMELHEGNADDWRSCCSSGT
jgi:arabinosaccharide transport system substrate-binding protein